MTQLLSDRKLSSGVLSIKIVPPSDMVTFFAIPGASGKVRLKLEMPEDANSVMIRYKTTAWESGDTYATGTSVATLTDNYNLANEWYEVSELTNGTAYYFKAFPYNGLYNSTIGENETICKAGGLIAEYTFDSVSGTTLYDTAGSINATMSDVTLEAGTVGNKGVLNGTSSYAKFTPNYSLSDVKAVSLILNSPASSSAVQYALALQHNDDYPCISICTTMDSKMTFATQNISVS